MTRVYLMCGPSGSGKSTYAAALEADGAVRLSFDEEMWRRGVTTLPASRELMVEIERDLRELIAEGQDVVLDFPFSTRAMRDEYRSFLEPFSVDVETIYLATGRDVVFERLRSRANQHADDLVLAEQLASEHFDSFEPPKVSEGALRIVDPPAP